MSKEILAEIKQLKNALTQVLGVAALPLNEQFSKEALDKAAKEFQKMQIERGNWVPEHDISKYIKNAGYMAGTFIRQEFGFTNYFKRGRTHFYSKQDLIALGKELKQRNVDLKRYIEFIQDQEKFKKYVASAKENNKGKRKGQSFKLDTEVQDVMISSPNPPDPAVIRNDIQRLKDEFFKNNFSDYVDIYKNRHAMIKFVYEFDKYIEAGFKKRCRKWCEEFNYANNALLSVTGKKESFTPIKDEDMIQL